MSSSPPLPITSVDHPAPPEAVSTPLTTPTFLAGELQIPPSFPLISKRLVILHTPSREYVSANAPSPRRPLPNNPLSTPQRPPLVSASSCSSFFRPGNSGVHPPYPKLSISELLEAMFTSSKKVPILLILFCTHSSTLKRGNFLSTSRHKRN